MNKAIFQVMGGYVIFFAAAMMLLGLYTMTGWSLHLTLPSSMSRLVFWLRLLTFVIPLAVVGVGLFRLRRWAALAFSAAALYIAYWACHDAIFAANPQPGDWNWVGFIFAALFTLPSIATWKYWSTLAWRGKEVGNSR